VISIRDAFRQGVKDEEWIPQVGAQGGVVITQDISIQTTRHQRDLYVAHGVGVFFVKAPKRGLAFWDIVKLLVKMWEDIKRKCKTNPPFAFRCTSQGKIEKLL